MPNISETGWLFTNVCRTYATTDVVRPTAYLRYDLFTTSVANLCPVVRQVARAQHYGSPLVPSRNLLFLFRQLLNFRSLITCI